MRKVNYIFLCFTLLLVSKIAYAVDYTQDADCVGAWLCEQGAGTVLKDSSTANLNGTIVNSSWTTNVPAAYAKYSLKMDGSNGYVTFTANPAITSTFTVVCWIKLIQEADGHIVSCHPGMFLREYGTKSDIVAKTSGELVVQISTNSAIYNTWAHFAGTYDGTTLRGYLDGSLQTAKALTGNLSSLGTFRIGGYGGGGYVMRGWLTEIAIFKRALSSTEINDIITNGLKPSGGEEPPSEVTVSAPPRIIIFGD